MGKKIALLIGVSEYEPGLNPLPAAVNDVDAMERVLANLEMGGFADNITVLKNPQPQVMREAIEKLFAGRQKDDLLLFYFSGHGIKDFDSGRFYLSTSATRKEKSGLVKSSSIEANFLHGNINDSRSQRQVIILDCCFSGAIAQGMTVKDDGSVDIQQQLGGKGRAILTSSTSTQYSFEQEGSELSVYTRYIVEGIEKGAADKDGDGWISVDELHEYASAKVQEASPAMTPKFYPVEEGHKILLAKSPKNDPKLKYRKEVERIALEDNGEISILGRIILDEQRSNWGLSVEEAAAIENEVLEPYRQRQEKLQRYEQALSQVVQYEYPLSAKNVNRLKRLQNILKLRDEDLQEIEERIIAPKQAEYEQIQKQREEAEKLRQEELEKQYLEALLVQQEQEREAERLRQEELRKKKQEAERLRQEELRKKEQEAERLKQEELRKQSSSVIHTQQFEFQYATLTGFEERSQGFLGFGKKSIPKISRHQAKAEYFTEDLGNGVTIEIVAIPGGTFMMGSPNNEAERRDNESPQHKVTIQPFFMGRYPITQKQWAAVATFSKVKIDLNSDPANFKGGNLPIETISWDEASEFCARLSQHCQKQNPKRNYRLPSEAEWEYACRAETTTPFHFGETITTELANYDGNYTYGSAPKGECRQKTTDVGTFPPNAFGLYDMHGNVWEWCEDDWHENYNSAPTNGNAWLDGNNNDNQIKMLRGGCWNYAPGGCRSAFRGRLFRGNRYFNFGFRVVCVLPRTS
ncbi:extracellular ligand-binding receptor [Calothrix sp. NIES-4101]|nr:extracellular ligand-binding receptor [Calothrix sp. NIES-4101]